VIPGVAGAIMLLLSLYGLLQLPTNWLGPVLMIAGVAMMLIDIKVPGIVLSIGGVIAFLIGSMLIFTPPWVEPQVAAPVAQLNPWLIVGTTLGVGAFFTLGIAAAFRAQFSPLAAGRETLIGKTGIARQPLQPTGIVHIEGEEWTAENITGEEIPAGAHIRVVGFDGLRLRVERRFDNSERS
jgi:membrane-bound serine protease (ClpP class)